MIMLEHSQNIRTPWRLRFVMNGHPNYTLNEEGQEPRQGKSGSRERRMYSRLASEVVTGDKEVTGSVLKVYFRPK